ncbi:EboA domain-containing protein [Wenyingzhuangia sp. IMCC45574]
MLKEIIYKKLSNDEVHWLDQKIAAIKEDQSGKQFILTYSLIFRFITNEVLTWNDDEIDYIQSIYPSFDKETWNKHGLCRVLIMQQLSTTSNNSILQLLITTASFKEQIDLYKSLFFLENAKELTFLMEDGIRTNATDVLEAIALNNPFGATFLTEDAWNQLVLKAIFTERPLYKIYGLNERKNEKLALILNDFIHERWSAGRDISPEVWQLLRGYNNKLILGTAQKALSTATELEKKAVKTITEETSLNEEESKTFWMEIGMEFNK